MTMPQRFSTFTTPIRAYGFALIVTLCAAAVSLLFPSFFAVNPFTPFYLAAAITAWYGGRGAGLASVLGGAIAADYLSPPSHHFGFDVTGTLPRLLLFIAVASVIVSLVAAAHHRRGASVRPADDQEVPTDGRASAEDEHSERSVAERGLPLRLLDLRTHLTVATLAAAQLRRRHVSTIAAARLCVYVIRAHAQMLDDIKALEAELGEEGGSHDPAP
ncbi:MAG: DUF4118 domain-containing protein [Thermomicrobiales bacterium]